MKETYKVHLLKGSEFYFRGYFFNTEKDYWTTITIDSDDFDIRLINYPNWVKYMATKNLMIQVAKDIFKNVRCWKSVLLERCDMELVRA